MSVKYFELHRIVDENGERTIEVEIDYNPEEKLKIELQNFQRSNRNKLLREHIDIFNPLRWETLSENEKQAWRDYRQALLDVPQQEGFPENINWPVAPGA